MNTAPSPSAPSLLDRALAYANAGIPVFPCVPGAKTPLTSNGLHGATTDPDIITGWWRWRPEANIATPTGTTTFDVLDVDVHPGGTGYPAYHKAKQAGLLDGWIRAVRTPSGGLHLHYPGTDQRNGTLPSRHLDFRATGGYVLLPPSLGQCKDAAAASAAPTSPPTSTRSPRARHRDTRSKRVGRSSSSGRWSWPW